MDTLVSLLLLSGIGATGAALYKRHTISATVPVRAVPTEAPEPSGRPRHDVRVVIEDIPTEDPGPLPAAPMQATNADLDTLARTLWGEARSEPDAGVVAVAWVIRNRVVARRFPDSITGVCLKRWAFSCWLPEGPPYHGQLESLQALTDDDAQFQRMKRIARAVLSGEVRDPTNGADHYANESIIPKDAPAWRWIRTAATRQRIGDHTFYTGVA